MPICSRPVAVFGFTGDKAGFYSIEFMTAIIPGAAVPFCI